MDAITRLQEQIDKARAEIRSDGYSISIGEWISLYESKELDIHPEFQRFFRWSDSQKSRLIESILLGIPIPPIFVAQQSSGIWDVVDGLQRLSTIYQLVGILKDEKGNPVRPLVLQQTKYLPDLKGKSWENPTDEASSLTQPQKLIIKRSKILVSIILYESDVKAKYELFQRLNTGGSTLSPQEVRNSIIVMINQDLYTWLKKLSEIEDFRECIALTDKANDEQYDLDLILRFIIMRNLPDSQLSSIGDIGDFLTEEITNIAEKKSLNIEEEEEAFRATFSILREQLGSDSFKRFDVKKQRFVGGFLISGYEVVAMGVGYNYKKISGQNNLREIVQSVWSDASFITNSGSGVRASSRLPTTIPLGRKMFNV